MNKAIYKGRTTAEIELRQTTAGKAVAKFTIAVDGYKDKNGEKHSDFIPCVAWGVTADTLARYVNKGQEILVEGSMRSGSYQDKNHQDVKHYTLTCYVERFEFCGNKSSSSASTGLPAQTNEQLEQPAEVPNEYIELLSSEDMPF